MKRLCALFLLLPALCWGAEYQNANNRTGTQVDTAVEAGLAVDAAVKFLTDHASLSAAISSIGSSDARLLLDKDDTLTGNVTVPANVMLEAVPGNVITTGSNTLAINGPVRALRFQWFSGSGVVFGGLTDTVFPEWWGAAADPITPTDDSTAFALAFASLENGGTVQISGTGQYYLASDLDMPVATMLSSNRVWIGARPATEMIGAASSSALSRPQAADNGGGVIYLADAATIEMDKGCGVMGLIIVRHGMTMPANAAAVATWTGTAINSPDSRHNMFIEKVAIIGFAQAISLVGTDDDDPWTGQNRIQDVLIDCLAGIYINGSLDVCYISRVHAWPFASVNLDPGVKVDADSQRSGTAFFIDDSNDWTKFTDCFSYGYIRGFYILDANSVTLLNCGSDYTSTMSGQPVGIKIEGQVDGDAHGAAAEIRIIGYQAAGQYHGMNISTDTGNGSVQVIGSNFWDFDSNGILLDDGDLVVTGCRFRDMPQAIGINSASAGHISVDNNIFDGITTAVFAAHASQDMSNWHIGENNVYIDVTAAVNGNFATAVFSALDATPDVTGVKVWRTANITPDNIEGFDGDIYDGQELLVIGADGGMTTLEDEAVGGNLKLAGDFTLGNDDTMHLIYDGNTWNEISRSDN